MSTLTAILISGIALGAIYFLVASGLSLIYGLMDVLNFAHGAFLTIGAYAGLELSLHLYNGGGIAGFLGVLVVAALAGAAVAAAAEVLLIRPLYGRPVSQILITVGLDLVVVGLLLGVAGSDSRQIVVPVWLTEATRLGSLSIPNGDFAGLGAGLAVYVGLALFLKHTRFGLVIRAGAENRDMVQALGIDVSKAFTFVFALGGAAAGAAGLLYAVVFSGSLVGPTQGDQLLIFAFIVVVIGGLGSIRGSAIAGVVVGLVQVMSQYYLGSKSGWAEAGNISVVILLALVLSFRPTGLAGAKEI